MDKFFDEFLNKKIIDLTHLSDENSPSWPAEDSSELKISSYNTYENDGCLSLNISFAMGFGTHLDSPSHFFKNKKTISEIDLKHLIGQAAIIDITEKCDLNSDYELTIEDIQSFEIKYNPIKEDSIIILKTGWYRYFNNKAKYLNSNPNEKCDFINVGVMHFPGYSKDAAEYLVKEKKCLGIGIDTLSPDRGSSLVFDVHQIVLGSDKFIIENLNLEDANEGFCILICLPLKIKSLTESPVRVLAIYDK